MSTFEELAGEFYFDETDGTHGLMLWLTDEERDMLIHFCMRNNVSLETVFMLGLSCIIEATNSKDGAIILSGIQSIN